MMERSDSQYEARQLLDRLNANIKSISDFPSLSGGPQPSSNAASAWNSNNIRQQRPPQPQQPPPQQQRAPSVATSQHSLDNADNFRTQQPSSDDWPAPSVQSNGDNYRHGAGITFQQNQQAPIGQGQPANPQVQQNGFGAAPMAESPVSSSNTEQKPQQSAPNGQQPQQNKPIQRYADMSEEDKYGLAGLTAAFEARKQAEAGGPVDETLPPIMRSALFMGQDLQSLGMDLDSAEPMHQTFTPFPSATSGSSAYDFHDRHLIPDFTLPAAYTVTNVPPIQQRISVFSDETLFSIFYQNPLSLLQELVANELTMREWRYHTQLRQWLQKDSRENNAGASALAIIDLTNGAPVNQDPVRLTQHTEKGVYIFFDAMNWRRERREFVLDWEGLDDRGVQVGNAGAQGQGQGQGVGAGMGAQGMGGLRGAPGLEQRVPGLGAGGVSGVGIGGGGGGGAASGMGSSGITANSA